MSTAARAMTSNGVMMSGVIDVKGVPQLNGEGMHNACFYLRKTIGARFARAASTPQKQRGALAQLVDRLVRSRTKRSLRQDQSANSPPTKTPE